ncbi:MAG: RNA polymerase sigma factor [Polyangiaceae bacterium]
MDARALIDGLGVDRARFVQLARRRVASESDAEDVVQRAMMRAAQRASQLEDPSRGRAWFYRILHRALFDHHRRPRHDHPDGSLDDRPAPEVERRAPPCCCAPRLLSEIRPAYADVLRRVDWESEDPSSVAAALGISTGNLYVRLHRARTALRQRVEGHCGVTSIEPCLECTCAGPHRCG